MVGTMLKAFSVALLLVLLAGCTPPGYSARPPVKIPRGPDEFDVSLRTDPPGTCRAFSRLSSFISTTPFLDLKQQAVAAATQEALRCCMRPRVAYVSDWIQDVAGWEVTFACD